MKKYAFVFAGQGAQYIGMGQDFYHHFDYVKKMYEQASNILGFDVPSLCFQNNNSLQQTQYTQPCMLVTSCAIYEVIKTELNIIPEVGAGFSLGEYSALYASHIFSFQDILHLIKYRAAFMEEAAQLNPGKMAAIIGMNQDDLNTICCEVGNVHIANFNSPAQLVISGKVESVNQVIEKATPLSRKIVVLNVSGAFHSPLMTTAADKMFEVVKMYQSQTPLFDVIANYNAKPYDLKEIANTLKLQITSPVLWIDTINYIIDKYDIEGFIEIGPGKVLSGLIKKIVPNIKTISINDINDLQTLREELNELK